jgi:pimeloyl-ACP methyl ester carboxylesterase
MKKITQILILFLLSKSSVVYSQTNVMFLFHSLPQERIIELPGNISLSYAEQGSPEGTPVIFLHGYTDSWHSFDSVLANLPKSLHAFAISQRGHGNSDRPLSGYSPGDFSNDVAAFIKKLDLGPVILVGHSMGGVVVQRFAMDHPQLTKAVVIIGSATSVKNFSSVKEFVEMVNQLNDPIEPAFAEEFQKSTLATPIDNNYYKELVSESLKVPARVWKAILNDLMNYDPYGELNNIRKPTLIIWGDQDIFCNRESQDGLLKSIKGSRLLVYNGTGHAVHWEEPKRFSDDLLAFISTLNATK